MSIAGEEYTEWMQQQFTGQFLKALNAEYLLAQGETSVKELLALRPVRITPRWDCLLTK